MLVPSPMENLDKAHITLRHAAGHETVVTKGPRLRRVRPVHVEDMLRLAADIGQLRHARLHAESHLILGNARLRFRIADLGVDALIHVAQFVEHAAAQGRIDAFRIREIEDRIALGSKRDPGVFRRKKTAPPKPLVECLTTRLAVEHDKVGKIFVQAPETVTDPRSHTGTTRDLVAGLNVSNRRIVIDRLGPHRVDAGDIVRHRTGFREEVTDPPPAVPVLLEIKNAGSNRETRLRCRHRGEPLISTNRIREIDVKFFP